MYAFLDDGILRTISSILLAYLVQILGCVDMCLLHHGFGFVAQAQGSVVDMLQTNGQSSIGGILVGVYPHLMS